MIEVGIVGGAGYTAGELIRLLVNHKEANINFIYSTSNADNKVNRVHQDLVGHELYFTDKINSEVDVLFLCLGHGNSTSFLDKNRFSNSTKVIDLSNDFRLHDTRDFQENRFVYGLPEINKNEIIGSKYIANPGCFATAIQLALLPLARAGKLNNEIHINAVTGATGAGTSLSSTTHFAWRDNNFSSYKAFNHQHLDEIYQSVKQLMPQFNAEINFIPNRGNFSRGIHATIYTEYHESETTAIDLYKAFYAEAKFTQIAEEPIHLKQVVNTNNCFLHLLKHGNKLLITSCIDNLLKGASGQAVQNMNLMFGFKETEGLELKGSYF